MATQNQFQLLKQRRFLPYFITQFLGAFNDNVYRISLMILIAASYSQSQKDESDFLVNICAGVFILPFFLFSATAGEIADKYDKARLIRKIKFAEICIMAVVGVAFYLNSVTFLITILFFMGAQSTFFGPIKYSILPQHLSQSELVGGNGLVEMGTFIAILLGTIVGGLLISLDQNAKLAVSVTVLVVAFAGWLSSLFIPVIKKAKTTDPKLKIHWEPFTETWRTVKVAGQSRAIILSILGISWFWFYGTSFLTQIPNYNIRVLHGSENVITLLLAAFSVGIGVGSMLCERLSGHRVEIGLVPFGAIGLTLFAADLSFAHGPYPEIEVTVRTFFHSTANLRVLADISLMGLFGGFYIVPLYVILQDRSEPQERSRVIAANNILNVFLMTIASVFAIIILQLGLTIPQFFLVIAIMNAAITLYIFKLVPEFILRFLIWILVHTLYRIDAKGLRHIPLEGPAILCCNHVSFLDPLILMACVRRPIRFVMDYRIFKIPVLSFLFKTAGCIPISPSKESIEIKEKAFEAIAQALENGDLIGYFPEGGITHDGKIQTFRPGISHIVEKSPVPVIPIGLQGMWGSWFSRRHGRAMLHLPRKFIFAKVNVRVGNPLLPNTFSRKKLEEMIRQLRGNNP